MNTCSLCITENHPDASVCKACGATKVSRARAGILRGIAILGLSVIGLFILMAGRFLVGFGFIGAAFVIGATAPRQTVWMKTV